MYIRGNKADLKAFQEFIDEAINSDNGCAVLEDGKERKIVITCK